ncbi:hypothetical protein BCR42DRAFT_454421 [Absidia repens]|uniref:HTH APSES-type domain-containing protein n=1 Tax=Absidia repens TaxID=90262 RepID=A0A1X2I7C4_9FUNG|nr:hypothetical protein BCR42DRAFT_454421 [Absidia repens]
MSDKKTSHEDTIATTQPRPPRRKPALPNIHPDDAKDKVFTAILKALLKKGNKPSSPKELANDIVKHKYATLGGATPFATVSSRISQHFKRAAEHNPPRAPLLAKHVDQRHSRKINYSLITPGDNSASTMKPSSDSSSSAASPSPSLSQKSTLSATLRQQGQHPLLQHHGEKSLSSSSPKNDLEEKSSDSSITLSDEEPHQPMDSGSADQQHFLRSSSLTGSKSHRPSSALRRRKRTRTRDGSPGMGTHHQHHHQSDSDQDSSESKRPRRESSIIGFPSFSKHHHHHNTTNHMENTSPTKLDSDEDDSEAEYSDYYEDMMKGDETMAHIEISRRRSSVFRRPSSTVNSGSTTTTTTTTITPNDSTDSPKLVGRKLSLPLNGLLGDNEFWTPYTFEQDLTNDNMYIPEHNSSNHSHPQMNHQPQISLNIVPPESISETELELYFGGPTLSTNTSGNNNNNNNKWLNPNLSNASARTARKSFCSVSNGKEASLLHRALMANSARGRLSPTTTKVDDDDDDDDDNEVEPPMRRRSWPLVGTALMNQDDEPISFDNRTPDKATSEEPHQDVRKSAATALIQQQPSKYVEGYNDTDRTSSREGNDEKGPGQNKTLDAAAIHLKEEAIESSVNNRDGDSTTSISKSYSENGHQFTITKKVLGNLQCYELDSPDDIPDTKVLRFIASNDGASEHVALRTRHADSTKHEQRRNSQHFYLVEGCVNATQLRKAARPVLGKGSFDATAEAEEGRLVVTLTKGSMECRGAWVTLARARKLVDEFEIESSPGLARLLGDDPMNEQHDSKRRTSSTSENNDAASPTSIISVDVPTGKLGSASAPVSSDEADDEEFVRFEEDDKTPTNTISQGDTKKMDAKPTPIITTPISTAPTSISPSSSNTNPPPTDTPNFNLSAFQQLAAAIPGLSNVTPTLDLARSFASYMQAVAKATSGSTTPHSPSVPSGTSVPSSPLAAFDIRSALARFPALDALLKKDSSLAGLQPTTSQSVPTSPTGGVPLGITDTNKIFPTTPTNPPIYITVIDNVTVCVANLSISGGDTADKTYNVMRRMDTGFVNGTTLLTVGGIDTERERSMILSFEMERIRIPNRNSELCGTWIPLRRAQELAVTCSIQNRLGPFLSDRLESYFSSTIPISRGPSGVRGGKPITGLRRSSSGSDHGNGNSLLMMSAAAAATESSQRKSASSTQLQQLLLSHPYKTLKLGGTNNSSHGTLKAPLLGNFDRTKDLRQQRSISVINSRRPYSKSDDDTPDSAGLEQRPKQQQPDVDIDILNDNDSDADTESDTDVNEVRQQMKRMRDAAIDAMETGHSMDLEELLSRASGPIVQPARSNHIRPSPLPATSTPGGSATTIKRRRLFDIDEEGNAPPAFRKPANFLPHGRRRPPTIGNSGPNSTWIGGGAGKLTTSMIKKSASWNGSLPLPRNNVVLPGNKKVANGSKRKKTTQRKNSNDDNNNNHVVEHQEKPTLVKSIGSSTTISNSISTVPATSSPLSSNIDATTTTNTSPNNKNEGPTIPKDQTTPPASDDTVSTTKSIALDEDEDEEIDIGGSDDDDDVR